MGFWLDSCPHSVPDPPQTPILVTFGSYFGTDLTIFKPVFNWKFKHYERLDLRNFPSPSPFPFAFPSPSSSPSPFLFPFPSPSPFLLLLLLHFLLLLFLRLHVQAGVAGWVGWGRSNPLGVFNIYIYMDHTVSEILQLMRTA